MHVRIDHCVYAVSLVEVPVFICLCSSCYCGLMINSTKSLGSGAGNISEPRLMSQVGGVRKLVCTQIIVFLPSERWRCQYSSAYEQLLSHD